MLAEGFRTVFIYRVDGFSQGMEKCAHIVLTVFTHPRLSDPVC